MKVLVTGGTGFIGYNLVSRLKRDGHEVTCLVRPTSNTRWLNSLGDISYVTGDLLAQESLEGVVDGFDWVFHLAGVVTAVNRDGYFRVNHGGTRNLVESIAKQNTRPDKFIFVSSLAAGGPSGVSQPRTEEMADNPINHYGESKRAAEIALKDYRDRFPIYVMRSPIVYGPLDTGVYSIFQAVQKGWQFKLTGEDLYLSLVYVEDLVDGLIRLAEHDIPTGEMFYISDHYQYTVDQIQTTLAHALDSDTRTIRVPRSLLYPVAGISELIIRARKKPSYLNFQKLKEIMQNAWTCSSEKLTRMTGFQAEYGLMDGAYRTADWYKSHGWL